MTAYLAELSCLYDRTNQDHARHCPISTSTGKISSHEAACTRVVQKTPMIVNMAEFSVRKMY